MTTLLLLLLMMITQLTSASSASSATTSRMLTLEDGPTTVTNGKYELTFDGATGMMTSVTNVQSNITTPLSIHWGWYNSSVGGCTEGIGMFEYSLGNLHS